MPKKRTPEPKAKKSHKNRTYREDFSQTAARVVREATEG
jgi:hypothetical protein